MGLEAVLERIQDNGKAEAAAIVAEAHTERERMLSAARVEGERLKAQREAEARELAARRRVQELARAELEAKKIVLGAQEQVLNEVRNRVRAKLAAATDATWLKKVLSANAPEWRAGRVHANARDAAAVRAIVGSNFGGPIECLGGIVIESGDSATRLDLTYDSILEDLWGDVIKEVALTLWPRS